MFIILTFLISLIPLDFIKIYLFRLIGIKIDKNSHLGFFVIFSNKNIQIDNSILESFNFIFAEDICIIDSKIKKGNYFKNLSKLKLISSSIGNFNKFVTDKRHKIKNNSLIIKSSTIYNQNLFDLTANIYLERTKICNLNQFWTHGFDIFRKITPGDIEIKNDVLINNSNIIVPGVKIANKVRILHGTVIHKDIIESGEYKSNLICKT